MPPSAKAIGAKPRKAALEVPEEDQDAHEAAQAASLLAEVMIGTPRANAHRQTLVNPLSSSTPRGTKRELLPTPLPATIQPPSIVLQHSMHPPSQAPDADQALIARYDYLTPREMEKTLAEQDHQQRQGTDDAPGDDNNSAVSAPATVDEAMVEEQDDDGWYVDRLLARRRLKGDDSGAPGEWQYLVRWQGKGEEDDRWVPESALDPSFIEADMAEAIASGEGTEVAALLSARGAARA